MAPRGMYACAVLYAACAAVRADVVDADALLPHVDETTGDIPDLEDLLRQASRAQEDVDSGVPATEAEPVTRKGPQRGRLETGPRRQPAALRGAAHGDEGHSARGKARGEAGATAAAEEVAEAAFASTVAGAETATAPLADDDWTATNEDLSGSVNDEDNDIEDDFHFDDEAEEEYETPFALRVDKQTLGMLRRWANFGNGVMLSLLGPIAFALSAARLALDKMLLSLYVSAFGILFASQELKVEPIVSWLKDNFHFMQTHSGRAAFLFFAGNLLWTFGRVGVVPAALTCANSVFNAKFESISARFD